MLKEIVRYKDVSIYQKDRLVLDKISLKISKGEFVYLIGKTGTGKTTLLKSMYADLPIHSGKAEIVGTSLNGLSSSKIPELRRKIGIVFQDFNLLMDRSVEENLLFVLKATNWKDQKVMHQRVGMVLSLVGLGGFEKKMPHTMSGGEQQRLVIARALLNKPEILIADEPTGNLDPETSDDILKLLRQLSKDFNTAVLFATHDFRILENFPARIIRCYDHQLVEEEDIY